VKLKATIKPFLNFPLASAVSKLSIMPMHLTPNLSEEDPDLCIP
jgi:hypothetical protein